MPSKDTLYNGQKVIGFENPSYFEKAKDLRPSLYDEKVIGLGYTSMFLIHSDEALEIEKFKRARENKIEFAYDYGNLNGSYIIIDLEDEVVSLLEKEKAKLEIVESLKSKGFESSENAIFELENQSENDCLVVEKECDKVENPKVIALGMFKLSVSQSVSLISMTKTSCDSKNVENLDTFSSVRIPKQSSVIGRRKGRLILLMLICLLLCDSFDENNLFIYDDESVRISPISKMPFRKKLRDSMNIVQICLWIIDLGCSKHMTCNRALLTNFVEKFLGTVRFGNNDFVVIAGYEDVVIGSMTIKKVYYVEGLGHYLFSVGQFCDKGLKVAFRKFTCFVRNEDGVDLLTSDRSSNLYTIALNKVASNSSTCLPKMKFKKDQLCFAYAQGKIHQKYHKSKTAFALNKPLYLLHMDLCGPMRVESINGKRYVLVVVDHYSRYTWVFFLHTKDEASEVIISFIKKTQVNLQLQVQRVRTDNGTEFKNKTLAKFFDEAEAIATACFTQNRFIIDERFDKTSYELMNKRKPNIKFFRVFGCRCYLLNDYEDVGKLKSKGDIGVFVGYSKESAAFRIYNKQTRKIHESVNVNFDEISKMASKQFS
nr:hypothetical protein [Tanacetum cinerariifolium]